MKNNLTLLFICLATLSFAKPLTFVTYHATSQYYPNMSASEIAAIVPYGGKLKLKVEPDVDSTHAKKKLKTANLLSEGDVQFGGTEETKGSLELKNVSGTAKSLETVDAYVQNLYLYNIQFPNTSNTMEWKPLTVNTLGGGKYTATFLTAGHTAPQLTCTASYPEQCHTYCNADFAGNVTQRVVSMTGTLPSAISSQYFSAAGTYYDVFAQADRYTAVVPYLDISYYGHDGIYCGSDFDDCEAAIQYYYYRDNIIPNKCQDADGNVPEIYATRSNVGWLALNASDKNAIKSRMESEAPNYLNCTQNSSATCIYPFALIGYADYQREYYYTVSGLTVKCGNPIYENYQTKIVCTAN